MKQHQRKPANFGSKLISRYHRMPEQLRFWGLLLILFLILLALIIISTNTLGRPPAEPGDIGYLRQIDSDNVCLSRSAKDKKHYFALPLMDSRKEEMQRTGLVIFVPRNTQVEVIEVDGDQFVVQILDPGFPEGKYVVNRYCFKLDATDDLWPAAVGDLGYIRESHGNDVAVAETSEGLRKYEDMSLGDRLSMDWHNDSSNPNSITVTPPYERYGVEMLDRNTRVRILKVSRTYLTVQIEDGHSAGRTFVVSRFNFYHRAS